MNGVPRNNILISPIRLTQRMIKTSPNLNPFTNSSNCRKVKDVKKQEACILRAIDEKWIDTSEDFSLWEGFHKDIEYNKTIISQSE